VLIAHSQEEKSRAICDLVSVAGVTPLAFGVEPYESLAESLGFMKRLHGVGDGQQQPPPPDPRNEELAREAQLDGGRRHTNPGPVFGPQGRVLKK